MKNLSGAITKIIIYEYGQDELLRRLSDPFWFQAFGCVLGFDWHSSGLTTTVCGALKEAINEEEFGIAICGGKGKASRKSPEEIIIKGEKLGLSDNNLSELIYASRMSAKVDNTCVQDGYQLYHHIFIFTERGEWSVIQQGMNNANNYARRYHWLSDNVKSFVEEPELIIGRKEEDVLNMVAKESREAQKTSVDIVKGTKFLSLPQQHEIRELTSRTITSLRQAYEIQPENYEELISIRGIGPQAVRALALISQLVYGAEPSWQDPVKFSFAHGGKDGVPYPVDRKTMDKNIDLLRVAVENAKIGEKEKLHAIRRLNDFIS